MRRQIETLKKELKELIQQEEFEKAANIRDQIRSLEQNLNANKKEGED